MLQNQYQNQVLDQYGTSSPSGCECLLKVAGGEFLWNLQKCFASFFQENMIASHLTCYNVLLQLSFDSYYSLFLIFCVGLALLHEILQEEPKNVKHLDEKNSNISNVVQTDEKGYAIWSIPCLNLSSSSFLMGYTASRSEWSFLIAFKYWQPLLPF